MANSIYNMLHKILVENGCSLYKKKAGSHEKWINPANGRKFPISVNIKSRDLANDILKIAGIKARL